MCQIIRPSLKEVLRYGRAPFVSPRLGGPQQAIFASYPPAAGGGIAVANAWKNAIVDTTVNVTVAPTATNFLCATLTCFGGAHANHAVSDNIGGTTGWVKVVGLADAGSGEYSLWYKPNVPAGITTVTTNGGAATVSVIGIVQEASGVTTFTGGEVVSGTTSAQSAYSPGNVNNATADSVLFGLYGTEDIGSNPATITLNSGGTTGTWSYVNNDCRELDGVSFIMVASMPAIVVAATGNKTHVWGGLNNTGHNTAIIAAFH